MEPDTLRKTVYAICKRKGISTAQLAEKLGISYTGLKINLQPGRDPKLSTLTRLADALGVTLAEIVDPLHALHPSADEECVNRIVEKVQSVEAPRFNNAMDCPYCGKMFYIATARIPEIFNQIK